MLTNCLQVKHVQKRLRVQKRLFENECALLLRSVVKNQDELDSILDAGLLAPDVKNIHDEQLQRHLGSDNYQCFSEIVGEMLEQLCSIQGDLQVFENQDCTPGSFGSARRKVGDLRNAITIAFEKNVYLRKIRTLAELCEELRVLRSQLCENKAVAEAIAPSKRPNERGVFNRFHAIRSASSALHEAFANTWPNSCAEVTHSQHKTIICVDAEVDDVVRLDLAVSYECFMPDR
jgi:hypothetical protein